MEEAIGLVGSFAFATVLIPQVFKAWRTKDVSGLSVWFLFLNYMGQLFSLVYVVLVDSKTGGFSLPLYLNYIIGFVMNSILVYFKLSGRR